MTITTGDRVTFRETLFGGQEVVRKGIVTREYPSYYLIDLGKYTTTLSKPLTQVVMRLRGGM